MYYKTLSVLALSAAALAAPQENSWDSKMQEAAGDDVDPQMLSAAAGIFTNPTSLAQAGMIPTSAAESIVSAIPSGYIQSLVSNPSDFESVAQDLATGKYPDWFSSEVPVSIQTQIAASSAAYSGSSNLIPTGSSSGSASASATPSDSASASSDSASASSSASESASASGSPTDNGAPAPTAMAMGVAGAAGVLGLALVL